MQDGYFLVVGQDEAASHSVTGTPPSTGYNLFPGVDTPHLFDFGPVNHTCSSNRTATNITEVNECSNANSGVCCIDTTPYQVGQLLLLLSLLRQLPHTAWQRAVPNSNEQHFTNSKRGLCMC